jgi:hypothetical protein
VPASPARGYPLQATQRAQFRRLSAIGRGRVSRVPAAYLVGLCRPVCPWQCVPPRGARGVVFLAGLWVAVAICASRAYGRSRRVSVGAPVRCVRRGPVAARRVPLACLWRAVAYLWRAVAYLWRAVAYLWRAVACPSFARMMRRTGSVAASIRRPMARLALRAGPEGAPDAEPP